MQPLHSTTVPPSSPGLHLCVCICASLRLSNCRHANVSLAGGVLDGERIVCPAHAACFNACSGDIEDGPVLDKLATYKVNVAADGELLVELSAGWDKQVRGVKRDMCNHEPAADKRHFVIIGGGAAGAAASEELRARGFKGAITMVCKEACPPYERPKLSKSLGTEGRDVALRKGADEFYASKGITLRLGVAATRVSPSAKQVLLSDGSVLSYDKLLCATGGTPRRFLPGESFTTPGAGLGNVFPLRDADHSVAIAAAVEAITKAGGACPVVIVGSSFIGMETAAYLRNFAKLPDVTVVGMEGAPFERAMGPVVGDAFRRAFEAKGVKFRLGRPAGVVNSYNALDAAAGSASGAGAAASASAGVVGSVTLGDGTVLPARVVVIGAGVLPTTDYIDNEDAKGAGVDVRKMGPGEIGGVVVNSGMQTGNADIFAAGDMAQFPYTVKDASGAAHSHPWRIEHWDVAYDHGRVAAANMLGARDVVYDNVPFFWTGFFGVAVRELPCTTLDALPTYTLRLPLPLSFLLPFRHLLFSHLASRLFSSTLPSLLFSELQALLATLRTPCSLPSAPSSCTATWTCSSQTARQLLRRPVPATASAPTTSRAAVYRQWLLPVQRATLMLQRPWS